MDLTDSSGSKAWPAWFYGPDDQAQIFKNEDEVPDGWEDHPTKVGKPQKDDGGDDPNLDAVLGAKYEGLKDAEVVTELKTRNLQFSEKWPRTKMVQTLIADDKKKAK